MEFIPVYQPDLSGNELKYVTECVESTWISSLGKYIGAFEEAFADYCGVKYGVSCANGTVALHLALAAYNIGPGDEVIVPTLTFVATANVVRYTGATPVLVDVDPQTWVMNPALIEEKITSRTKAIIPVHIYGHPVDMDPIMELADKYHLIVIEDAAEAHGAEYKGRKVGSLGHAAAFSFYGNKVITTGEGGMVVTNDAALAERARFLKDHGMSKEKRYWHPEVAYNYRMTNIQAAIGLAQLERIDAIIARKREIAQLYNAQLADCPGIVLPPEAPWARNIYWLYSILISEEAPITRDQVMAVLKEQGIDSRPFFYPMHQMPPYYSEQPFPVADRLSATGINLPSWPKLLDEDIRFICDTLKTIL